MLKHLNLDEMIALLSPWVEDPKQRKVFLSIPEVAPLHPRVVEAHEAVIAVQPSSRGTSSKMRALIAEGNEVDRCHDHLARAVSYGVDARRELCLAEAPADADGAARCDLVQKKLFPNGLSILNASPLAEAGNTTRIARLLEEEPEIAGVLRSIPARGKTTLLDVVKQWLTKGRELQAIERARTELEATETTTPVTKTTIQSARSQWFKVVSLVLSNLEMSRAPARDIEIIRGPVLRASGRAGKRYVSGKPEVAPAEEEAAEEEEVSPASTSGEADPSDDEDDDEGAVS
ncbi:hypothetical protein [Sorangium sp. So ce1335]|uniref:hypothetical protein n=1 Tax=Sorangium sp. So ce1335 TaxID=3133335 RepID=UPI003F5F2355